MTTNQPGETPIEEFKLKFSHNIIEHLGLKLYQNKPTNVIAELVSNSWDADAKSVWVHLKNTESGTPESIIVADNGLGMTASELQGNYLIVGKPKRPKNDPTVLTPGKRPPMGRKGIGKLAPFGVARVLDLITISSGKVNWLSFNYDAITAKSGDYESLTEYQPDVISNNLDLEQFKTTVVMPDEISEYFNKINETETHGTIIWAKNLTLKRPISPDALLKSLGRRFTVTVARPDFKVAVNNTQLTDTHVYPDWELRIPETGKLTAIIETPYGNKEVTYWAGFVGSATWTSDESGVGIYAHGKIAQDRPFTFFNKGNEIFTRYLYAVIEADWIDELEEDAISTDRTSIDWENSDFDKFKEWGDKELKSWVRSYQELKKQKAKEENTKLVDAVTKSKSIHLRDTEKQHLVDLLSDVTPTMSKDEESKNKLVEATAKAWLHEPARKLIKKLWEETSKFNPEHFPLVVGNLTEQLIPESLSLAVVFSQRVFALTELQRHIMHSKETQLQKLIERFPWIISNEYEKLIPRTSLKKLCEEGIDKDVFPKREVHSSAGSTMPDIVFLGDANNQFILIVELKGPEITAAWGEDEQLTSYVRYIKSRFPSSQVYGLLIAGGFDSDVIESSNKLNSFKKWDEILYKSRKEHMELLAALIAGSDADALDTRVQQICELGGTAVNDFLEDMRKRVPEIDQLFRDFSGESQVTNVEITSG
jgi:hypothetical protein